MLSPAEVPLFVLSLALLACRPAAELPGGAVSTFSPLAEDCGPDGVEPGSVPGLERWPHVQWVTEDAATVAWGGSLDAAAGALSVRLGEEAPVEVAAERFTLEGSDGELQRFHARVTGLTAGTDY